MGDMTSVIWDTVSFIQLYNIYKTKIQNKIENLQFSLCFTLMIVVYTFGTTFCGVQQTSSGRICGSMARQVKRSRLTQKPG